MYFYNNNIFLKKKLFKKRKLMIYKLKEKKGLIFYKKHILIELRIIKKMLVFLKRLYKKKKINIKINLKKNHIISKKSKNARMGKGKGKYKRFLYKNKLNRPIIEFPLMSVFRQKNLLKQWNLKKLFLLV